MPAVAGCNPRNAEFGRAPAAGVAAGRLRGPDSWPEWGQTRPEAQTMTWADFYLVCFLIGFLLSLVSLIIGHMNLHFHFPSGDVHGFQIHWGNGGVHGGIHAGAH